MIEIFVREFAANLNHWAARQRHKFIDKCAASVIQNLDILSSIEGAFTSLKFERNHLKNVPYFKSRKDLYKYCLDNSNNIGACLEFGVYKGDSINLMAKLHPSKSFTGFDSFEGLPENWTTGAPKGAFNVKNRLPKVRGNIKLIPGFFENTLENFLTHTKLDNGISLIHIDCDLYSSTKFVLKTLDPYIQKNTVIVFDELYNYGDWQEGEIKALNEYIEETGKKFHYLAYIRIGSQVAIKFN